MAGRILYVCANFMYIYTINGESQPIKISSYSQIIFSQMTALLNKTMITP